MPMNRLFWLCVLSGMAAFFVAGCDLPDRPIPGVTKEKESSPEEIVYENVGPEQQKEFEELRLAMAAPDEKDLPLPPEGWYELALGEDTIEVFRDDYGVPHIFAPSIEAAFRAQGFVMMEDRCIQLLKMRQAVRALRCLSEGKGPVGADSDVRIRGYSDEELQAMVDGLRPEQLLYSQSYLAGVNDYLRAYLPNAKPLDMLDLASGAVYFLKSIGDWGGDEHHIHELLLLLKALRGEEFAWDMLNDCIPLDVPNAPTTDHSHKRLNGQLAQAPPPRPDELDLAAMVRIGDAEAEIEESSQAAGLITHWGSFSWSVRPERSQTGNAMFFGAPFLGFGLPSRAVLVHMIAPGMNVIGMAFPGTPGVLVGHNDRVAFTSTSGLMDTTDMFVETTNPDNPHQYFYKGEWRDMESRDASFPVRNPDGTYRMEPLTVYRTVHGPVVDWNAAENRVYARATSFRGLELKSFLAFLDMNFAREMDDVETACRDIATTHNIFAADTDGNIGYWLAGRIAKRSPKADTRLPVPGTGEYDWEGYVCHTDLVACVNPPEGWFANWNNKPSVKTPLWFPEATWAVRLFQIPEQENPMTWERFWEVNRENGLCHFMAVYLKPYLLRIIQEHNDGSPEVAHAVNLLENWPNERVSGSAGALLFEEWFKETMQRIFVPDFGPLVVRSIKLEDMRLFGGLMIRILLPEIAGVPVNGDYLHGRNPNDIAYESFRDVLDALIEEHGPIMGMWPYEPIPILGGAKDPFGKPLGRDCGTYWMALDMGKMIKGKWMTVPGQCERKDSPHYSDQYDLFLNWQGHDMMFYPEDFGKKSSDYGL